MFYPRFLAALTGVLLLLAACGGGSPMQQAAAPAATTAPAAASAPAAGENALDARGAPTGSGATAPTTPNQPAQQRLVIKNADLSLEVKDVRSAETSVRDRVAQLNGYVVSSETRGVDARATVTMSFRVPAARFDEALSGVAGLAEKVNRRAISGDDVTEEFVDLDSRLRNLEATRDRLLTLLQKAERVEDALAVNESLTQVQGELEQIRGRMQYLQQSAAMSTINVELTPVVVVAIVEPDGWQPMAVARGALRTLVGFGQGLVNALIVLVIWSPIWGLPVLGIVWLVRRSRRNGQKAPPPVSPEPRV